MFPPIFPLIPPDLGAQLEGDAMEELGFGFGEKRKEGGRREESRDGFVYGQVAPKDAA